MHLLILWDSAKLVSFYKLLSLWQETRRGRVLYLSITARRNQGHNDRCVPKSLFSMVEATPRASVLLKDWMRAMRTPKASGKCFAWVKRRPPAGQLKPFFSLYCFCSMLSKHSIYFYIFCDYNKKYSFNWTHNLLRMIWGWMGRHCQHSSVS